MPESLTDPLLAELESHERYAWRQYGSTCRMGGVEAERAGAFRKAMLTTEAVCEHTQAQRVAK